MKSKWQDYKNSAEKAQAEGKYSFAESLWYAALEESMDFPANDRRRALSMERLCECLWFQQKFADCEPLALKLVAIYTEVFGPDHVDVAAMHANLGLLYVAMKRDEDAEQPMRKALEIKLKALGPAHPDVLRLQTGYRDLFNRLKEKGTAPLVTARQWKKTGRFETLPGPKVEATIPQVVPKIDLDEMQRRWKPLYDAASSALDQGDWQTAATKFAEAAQMAEHFGEKDHRLCRTIEGLAAALARQDKHQQAAPYYERIFQLKKAVFGSRHPVVAQALDEVAKCHYYYGNFEAAEKCAEESCRTYEILYGRDDIKVATSLGNLGMLYHLDKKLSDAEDAYKRCLAIRTKRQGASHDDTIKLLNKYAALLREMHREDEAAHLQSCASGFVTGSWKTITMHTEDSLAPSADDESMS
jgi:tetratricopeptide (TPR) repeat protein